MKDQDKTKGQFTDEVVEMRRRISELEKSETEHKQAEEVIQEAREYAENIVETVRHPLVVLDGELRVVSCNRSFYETFKVASEETKGQLVYDLGNRQWDIPKLRELLEEVLPENTIIQDFAVEHDFPTIGRRMMLLNARRIHKEANKTQMILLAIEDITEHKQMQERLLISERLATLGQFSGSISHELRNPLSVIDSSAYYLTIRLKDADEKVQEHLDRIQSSVHSATAIIESLLNMTRMKEPQLVRLDLIAIISRIIAISKIPATLNIIRNFPEQEVLVAADREQLRMAFQNIIKNAVEAMDGKGTLAVTVNTSADGQAEVSFADTGPGIAPENLDRIFQPLFSTKAKGIGFGLSIAKMVIDKHGGTIAAKSEPGKGAIIIIQLPLHKDESREA